MPLFDHFDPAFDGTRRQWKSFHGAWAAAIARLLNHGVLPPGYYAAPFLGRGGPIKIDVAAVHEDQFDADVAPFAWQPNSPGVSVAIDLPATDEFRVDIRSDGGEPLAACIELVSPANKDRPESRRAFAAKCAGHLHRGTGVLIVDVVTRRHANMHAEILRALGAGPSSEDLAPLMAVSYRTAIQNLAGQLTTWAVNLEIGQPLPTLPLWLAADLAVRLDLEASHAATCDDLKIRIAG